MPMYLYRCRICGSDVEVERPIDRRDVPPREDEAPGACADQAPHTWIRQLPTGVVLARGPNWTGGSKGNW